MKFNLQFFGEEDVTESVNESVVAEQTEVEDGGDAIETVSEEVEETPTVQDADTNRIYADARRRAEREAREAQEKVDAEYVRRFGNYKIPRQVNQFVLRLTTSQHSMPRNRSMRKGNFLKKE